MTEEKKIKILTLSDHPFSPSGVGTQTRYMIESMLETGKFSFICLGGAIKHMDNRLMKVEKWEDDWLIIPVDGYGDQNTVRSVIRQYKPDMLWFMTDPRFYGWLWSIENEIRPLIPMVYYHVWDNYPYPEYNRKLYKSTDTIVTISKLTSDIVRNVAPDVEEYYLPHAVNTEMFKKLPESDVKLWREKNMDWTKDKFMFFWNNRNARRKQSGTIIWWFKEFLDKVGHDKVCLIMHTDPKDMNGQDLLLIMRDLDLIENKQVILSTAKVEPNMLAMFYNAADCVLNVSDAEGFGLATFEALACEKPIIVNMTGGLQEQVTKVKELSEEIMLNRAETIPGITIYEHGIGIEPISKTVIGSQETPYIYEDRISKKDFISALETMMNLSQEKRDSMGKLGREHVMKNYNFDNFRKQWEKILLDTYKKHGSWETRKLQHKTWELRTI